MTDSNGLSDSLPPYLSVRVIRDEDYPERREVEVRVATHDGWSGIAQTGTVPDSLRDDARSLERWSDPLTPEGEAVVEFGGSSYEGARLRFFVANMAGHIACEAELTRRVHRSVPGVGEERRLSVLLWTDPMAVNRFARLLALFAEGSDEEVELFCLERRL